MATRREATPRRGANRIEPVASNPFQRVEFRATDLTGVAPGGDGPTEFVDVDARYRLQLVQSLDQASAQMHAEVQASRNKLGTFILRLRQQAIAKSHRPIQLIAETGLLPAGHEQIDEVLVAAHAGSLTTLRDVVLRRNTKAIRANLSAITMIEPWGAERRVPSGRQSLRARGRAIVRLFRYGNDQANVAVEEAVIDELRGLHLNVQHLDAAAFGWSIFRLAGLEDASDQVLDRLSLLAGIRRIAPEPIAEPSATRTGAPSRVSGPSPAIGLPPDGLPTVAVFDTGVSAQAQQLQPWVDGFDTYVLPPDTDYEHGTHVASLVTSSHTMNANHPELPAYGSLVYDVCGLEAGSANITDLIERLKEAIPKRPDVKIWNLSLGVPVPCDEQSFSEFAMALDRLSDQHGVLFVVAAGNYLQQPRRIWPAGALLQDRIGSPAESIRALTVGSVCHAAGTDSLNAAGEPAAYSRRGPGPVFTPKPDIVHAGGNVHTPWNTGSSSMVVLRANDTMGHSFGTSFAAPVAATMAAHVWQSLAGAGRTPTPSLVKALMIHAAQLSSTAYSPAERRYFGTGLPLDVMDCLYDTPDSFTLLFETSLVPGMRWRRSPYPLPASLIHEDKFRGEVIITCVYAPPLDSNAGAEYVRANVELSFGVLSGDNITSKVPMKGEDYTDGYEAAQIEHGGKWAPVKVHRKAFPGGISGSEWALQARPYLRAFEPPLTQPIQAYIVCTLRSLSGDMSVHADGLRALNATNWISNSVPVRVPVRI
ncbi:S8 family anti-phage peptidase IteS [Variovorax boronicumulans]|uniref:S8 family anti-phage peptidase IteS n=1 Tax=Variovorax boronicumulans TaxID=436515 RepID=UPI0007846953